MFETKAYKTPDGKFFENEDKAIAHYHDLIGQELDGLMRLSKINLSRTDEYKLIMGWIAQPKELKKAINAIHALLNIEDQYS